MSKKWAERRTNVAYLEPAPPRFPAVIMAMSLEELREEWRQQENDLMRLGNLVDDVAHAVFDEYAGELPVPAEDFFEREDRASAPELVAAIKSLHELSDRQVAENEALRARIAELEARNA